VSAPGSGALAAHLERLIAIQGPLTVAQFMAEALLHPRHGTYMRANPIGLAGDFTTAPEISQMFGELIGLWCADCWQKLGAPGHVQLVELGPGRGTLMVDALRAAAMVPPFRAALRVHLVEVSPVMRALQRAALDGIANPPPVRWHDRLAELPDGPMLLIANEFFDALPIHQFLATPEGWRERMIAAADTGFRFVRAPGPTPAAALLRRGCPTDQPGAIAEVCPAGLAAARDIAARVLAGPGAALIIDFGGRDPRGDSWQAVRRHRRHDVLADPGNADLAAQVDFGALALAAAAAGAAVHGPIAQGVFLDALGIGMRAAALADRGDKARSKAVHLAHHRLTAPGEMGEHFKVLAITDPDMPACAGFDSP